MSVFISVRIFLMLWCIQLTRWTVVLVACDVDYALSMYRTATALWRGSSKTASDSTAARHSLPVSHHRTWNAPTARTLAIIDTCSLRGQCAGVQPRLKCWWGWGWGLGPNTGALAPRSRPKAGLGVGCGRGSPLPLWGSGFFSFSLVWFYWTSAKNIKP